jgi:hypothetical protein
MLTELTGLQARTQRGTARLQPPPPPPPIEILNIADFVDTMSGFMWFAFQPKSASEIGLWLVIWTSEKWN